ncbi:MAG: CGNR zinc finger domain-containing protein [Micromonosporaceae bacterium]
MQPGRERLRRHDRHRRYHRRQLRALIAANNAAPEGAGPDSSAAGDAAGSLGDDAGDPLRDDAGDPLGELAGLAYTLPLVVDVTARPPQLTAAHPGTVEAALASLLAAVAEAVAAGTWDRLKACRNPRCQWAYYDQSRNRSRAWCSMDTCGNRAKARAFRRRT